MFSLESNPIGTITKAAKGNEITLHCSVAYSGFWPPTMEWRLNEQKEESTTVEKTKNHVSATLKIWPHETDRRRFSQYSCVTYFDASKKPENSSATNVPSFVYTWTPRKRVLNTTFCHVMLQGINFVPFQTDCKSAD